MLDIDKIVLIKINDKEVSKSKILKQYSKKLGLKYYDIKLTGEKGSMLYKVLVALKRHADLNDSYLLPTKVTILLVAILITFACLVTIFL